MNNAAAIGYMIIAAKEIHLHPKVIEELEYAMRRAMDLHTEEEAEEVYRNN